MEQLSGQLQACQWMDDGSQKLFCMLSRVFKLHSQPGCHRHAC